MPFERATALNKMIAEVHRQDGFTMLFELYDLYPFYNRPVLNRTGPMVKPSRRPTAATDQQFRQQPASTVTVLEGHTRITGRRGALPAVARRRPGPAERPATCGSGHDPTGTRGRARLRRAQARV